MICRRWYTLADILNWFVRVSLFLFYLLQLIMPRNYRSSFFSLHICIFTMQTISIIQMNCNQTTATALTFSTDDWCNIVSSAARRIENFQVKMKLKWPLYTYHALVSLNQWFINFLYQTYRPNSGDNMHFKTHFKIALQPRICWVLIDILHAYFIIYLISMRLTNNQQPLEHNGAIQSNLYPYVIHQVHATYWFHKMND